MMLAPQVVIHRQYSKSESKVKFKFSVAPSSNELQTNRANEVGHLLYNISAIKSHSEYVNTRTGSDSQI